MESYERSWKLTGFLSTASGMDNVLGVLIIFSILLTLSALFSATETAFSTVNEIRIKQIAKTSTGRKQKKAQRILVLLRNYGSVISTVLVANNLVNLTASALMTYLFSVTLGLQEQGVLISTVVVSILIIVLGEIMPKNIAQVYATRFALFIVNPFYWIVLILKPITFFFAKIHERIEGSVSDQSEKVTATEDELLEIVETIEKEGVLEQTESEIIQSAITFDDIEVEKVMVPKEKTMVVNEKDSFDQIVNTFTVSKFSRIPVINEKNEVLGIIRQQSVFDALAKKIPQTPKQLMGPAIFISKRRLLPYALEKLQQQKSHMAIVVENLKNKEFLGVVTLEDILEEIVGEIYDEYDDLPKDIVEIGHHIFEVSSHVALEELFDRYLEDTPFPKTTALTVGAWVRQLFGTRLAIGEEFHYDNLLIRINEIDGQAIKRVEIHQFTKAEQEE